MRESTQDATGPAMLIISFAAIIFGLAYASNAWSEPVADASKVSRDWAGAFAGTESWCVDVTDTAADLMDRTGWSAAVQARVSTAELGEMRYVEVQHADATDASVAVCLALGDSLGSSVACDPAGAPDTTGARLYGENASRLFHVRRTKQRGAVTGAVPELWAEAPAGQTVTVCLTLGS